MIHELVRALVTATGAECSRRELGCVHQDVLSAIFRTRTLYYRSDTSIFKMCFILAVVL